MASCYQSKGEKCLDCAVFKIICVDEDESQHSFKENMQFDSFGHFC